MVDASRGDELLGRRDGKQPLLKTETGPTPVAAGGAITPPGTTPPAGVTYSLYTTGGNKLYSTEGVYQPGDPAATSVQTEYTLYAGNTVTLNGNTVSCASTPKYPSLPCAEIDASGLVTQYAYDPYGDLISMSTPDGNGSEVATTTYTYDADGEQLSVTTPDGNLPGANPGNYTKVTTYNADGLTTSETQGGGAGASVSPRVTTYGYDANGNKTSSTDPRGFTITTTYDPDDAPTLVTDPMGNETLTCYDGDGNPTQTIPPAGVAAGSLTPANCPTSYSYPSTGYGNRLAADATTEIYDVNSDVTAMTTPAPAGQSGYETTTNTYDGAGNLLTTTSPPAVTGGPDQVTSDTYDADGQLVSTTVGYGSGAASTTSYCYDLDGNRTSVVPPDGNVSGIASCETGSPYQTTYSYNTSGELVSSTSPATAAALNGATTINTFDSNGNVVTSTDPDGVTSTKSYNSAGMLTGISYSGAAAPSVSFTYDADGIQTGMTDGTGSTSYIHDPFGELTSVTNGAGQTVSYTYDADGHATGVTYPLPPPRRGRPAIQSATPMTRTGCSTR